MTFWQTAGTVDETVFEVEVVFVCVEVNVDVVCLGVFEESELNGVFLVVINTAITIIIIIAIIIIGNLLI